MLKRLAATVALALLAGAGLAYPVGAADGEAPLQDREIRSPLVPAKAGTQFTCSAASGPPLSRIDANIREEAATLCVVRGSLRSHLTMTDACASPPPRHPEVLAEGEPRRTHNAEAAYVSAYALSQGRAETGIDHPDSVEDVAKATKLASYLGAAPALFADEAPAYEAVDYYGYGPYYTGVPYWRYHYGMPYSAYPYAAPHSRYGRTQSYSGSGYWDAPAYGYYRPYYKPYWTRPAPRFY